MVVRFCMNRPLMNVRAFLKKIVLLFHLSYALGLSTPTDAAEWACVEGNCRDGIGRAEDKKFNNVYSEFKNGKSHGYGVFFYNNSICEGFSLGGQRNGLRQCLFKKSGNRFFGDYYKNVRYGEGLIVNKRGEVTAEGVFENGKLKTKKLIDRNALLKRFTHMRRTAPEALKRKLPEELKVFQIPLNGELSWNNPAQSPEIGKPKLTPKPTPKPKPKPKPTPTEREATVLKITRPDTLPAQFSDGARQEKPMLKINEPKTQAQTKGGSVNDARIWAEDLCRKEGYTDVGGYFEHCVSEMMPLF